VTRVKTQPFDAANYLETEDDITEYLRFVLNVSDTKLLAAALSDIARARSMRQIASETELPRQSKYKN